ncbi:MAG TPA: phospho-sugar mutase, partial [Dermatophilaceae bacterium]|nr:phospho-sugar mutase [Dermatophilaceae bacterium]
MPYAVPRDLLERATSWREDDPDEATRAELDAVLEAARSGDAGAAADLADRFAGILEFGTAGLRGAMGAGPNRMNRSVVIRTAAGLTAYLQESIPEPLVVIGFDARHNSEVFAADTAAVVVAAGGRAMVLPRPLPTPVLAFAIRHLGADAGVMVTASHNPAQDNGYKVFLGDGSQIVPPSDAQIAEHIAEVGLVADVPRASSGWTTLNEEVLEAYLDAAAAVVSPDSPRELSVVHTALHGVGSEVMVAAFERAGFGAPIVVPSQSEPDPDFPTVSFPNPEEPGAIDAALALAARVHPDVVLANDPDADRCAVAVPDPAAVASTSTAPDPSGWRMLRGDEVG